MSAWHARHARHAAPYRTSFSSSYYILYFCSVMNGSYILVISPDLQVVRKRRGALLDDTLSRLQKLYRVSHDIMVIGVKNSSVSNLSTKYTHIITHITLLNIFIYKYYTFLQKVNK